MAILLVTLTDGSTITLPGKDFVLTNHGFVSVEDLTYRERPTRLLSLAAPIRGRAPTQTGLEDRITQTWSSTAVVNSTSVVTSSRLPTGILASITLVVVKEADVPAAQARFCGCAIPEAVLPCPGQQIVQLPTPAVT